MVQHGLIPRQWGYSDEMEQTIIAALARQRLRSSEQSKALTPDELAALARVSRKSMMNLIAPGKSGVLQKDADDKSQSIAQSAGYSLGMIFKRRFGSSSMTANPHRFRNRSPRPSSSRYSSPWLATEAGFRRQIVTSEITSFTSVTVTINKSSIITGRLSTFFLRLHHRAGAMLT